MSIGSYHKKLTYDIGNKQGYTFNWTKVNAKRGANEIFSFVYHYLVHLSQINANITKVRLYSDGCIGQNKNSILPSMLFYFLKNSQKINTITLNYFIPGHGESEGDSMHSCIEGCIQRAGNVSLPQEINAITRIACKKPFFVVGSDVQVLDFKQFRTELGILRNRTSKSGKEIDWTKICELKVIYGRK